MPKILLNSTETESVTLDDNYWGRYQVNCTKYGTSPVSLQFRDPDQSLTDSPWVTARYNGTEIQWAAAGDSLEIELTIGFAYRFSTTAAGAVISMDKH